MLVMTLDPKGPRLTPSDPNFNVHGGMLLRQDGDDMQLHLSGVTMQDFLKTLWTGTATSRSSTRPA